MDPTFSIESERLRLVQLQSARNDHCELLLKLYTEPLFIEGEGNTGIDTFEKAQKRITRFEEDLVRNGYGQYLVTLKESGKMIGTVSLMRGKDDDPTTLPLPDIGFAIITEENGKGYGPEAARRLIEWVTKEHGLEGVFGFCDSKNARSRRAMEKSGLVYKGLFKLYQFGGPEGCCFALPDMKDPTEYGVGVPPKEKSS